MLVCGFVQLCMVSFPLLPWPCEEIQFHEDTRLTETSRLQEAVVTICLGSCPEAGCPPSGLCVYVFPQQLGRDANSGRKGLQAKSASDQRRTVETPGHLYWISSQQWNLVPEEKGANSIKGIMLHGVKYTFQTFHSNPGFCQLILPKTSLKKNLSIGQQH